jgi:hypothetical protein
MDFISDIEKIINNYADPNTYQTLIRIDPKLYNWKKYIDTHNPDFIEAVKYENSGLYNALLKIKDLILDDIRNIVEYDNLRFLKIAVKKYPDLIYFELFLDAIEYDSYKCLSFLIDKFQISYEQYSELLTICIELDDLKMLRFLNKKIQINSEDIEPLINLAKIYKNKEMIKFLSSLDISIFM